MLDQLRNYLLQEDVNLTVLADGSSALLDIKSGSVFSINDSGTLIIKLLRDQPGLQTEDLVKAMCDAFVIEEEQARADLEDFVREFASLRDASPSDGE